MDNSKHYNELFMCYNIIKIQQGHQYYGVDKPTKVSVDASSYGLGARSL